MGSRLRVRGQPFGQPLQALESAVVRELFSSAGSAGRYSEGRWWTRPLGIPTVADRIAQEVARRYLEPIVEPVFHADSYGYRPGKSAIEAVRKARERCWRYDWVLDLDVSGFFDSIDWELMLKVVRHHTDCRVDAALYRTLAEGACADRGWQYRAARGGYAAGRGHLALC